jgi:DMSO/TMAO reductase YedYZ molybdopterin-dependent catalytic subunit
VHTHRSVRWAAAAAAGLLAAAAGIATSSGVAVLLTGVPTPVVSVGDHAIDMAPPGAKDFAIQHFGTNDKPVLVAGVLAVLTVAAVVAGLIGLRSRLTALAITALLGLVALAAELTDRTATAGKLTVAIPPVVAIVVSVGAMAWLLSTLATRAPRASRLSTAGSVAADNAVADTAHDPTDPGASHDIGTAEVPEADRLAGHPDDDLVGDFDRRRFLVAAMATGAVAASGGAALQVFGGSSAAASRRGTVIPRATSRAVGMPAGVDLHVPGVSSYITDNRSFYRVDTALSVPDVPTGSYRLKVHGDVDNEIVLSYQELLAMPLMERRITLTCVSNEVGGPYVGNATWVGVSLNDLLDRVGIKSGADAIKTTSADGWTCGTPIQAIRNSKDSMLAVAMNGVPLPLTHGFPVRMIVPGLYGYVSATKWLTDIEVSNFKDFNAYWTTRGYSAEAPIKTSSRIDVPHSFAHLKQGKVPIAGVAWSQDRGIKRVQVRTSVDDQWHDAKLAHVDGVNSWRQWMWEWDAKPGSYNLEVRATDETGYTQTSARVSPRPNGSTGWHNVAVTVS